MLALSSCDCGGPIAEAGLTVRQLVMNFASIIDQAVVREAARLVAVEASPGDWKRSSLL
jgi:hypothetical protein